MKCDEEEFHPCLIFDDIDNWKGTHIRLGWKYLTVGTQLCSSPLDQVYYWRLFTNLQNITTILSLLTRCTNTKYLQD